MGAFDVRHDAVWVANCVELYAPVQGELFGEAPGPRKWASWELPYYGGMTLGAVILVVGLNAKPDTDIRTWARVEAKAILEADEEWTTTAARFDSYKDRA